MRVLIIADQNQEVELMMTSPNPGTDITWLREPGPVSGSFELCLDMLFVNAPARIDWLKSISTKLVIVNEVQSVLLDKSIVRINGWPGFIRAKVAELCGGNESDRSIAESTLEQMGKTVRWVPDVPGMLSPRIIAAIINEAFFTLEEKITTADEIDIAMKLGTNYPFGPMEWAQRIGLLKVYRLLLELSENQGRYTSSSLLKQMALA